LDQFGHLNAITNLFIVGGNLDSGGSYPLTRESSRLPLSGGRQMQIHLNTRSPASANIALQFTLEVPKNCDIEDEIIIGDTSGNQVFVARINEIIPILSPALLMRMSVCAEGVCAKALERLTQIAAIARDAYGY
jgi:hypothetical protein